MQFYFIFLQILFSYGRLGHGDSEDQLRPKLVESLINYRAVDIACGSGDAQTLCITDDDNGAYDVTIFFDDFFFSVESYD